MEDAAIARGKMSGGTTVGTNACRPGISNERAELAKNTIANIASRPSQPWNVPSASAAAHSARMIWQIAATTATVVAVRDLTDQRREPDQRKELHEPDDAEVERIAGHLVELPADRDALHLVGDGGRGANAPEPHEGWIAAQRSLGQFQARGRAGSSSSAGEESAMELLALL